MDLRRTPGTEHADPNLQAVPVGDVSISSQTVPPQVPLPEPPLPPLPTVPESPVHVAQAIVPIPAPVIATPEPSPDIPTTTPPPVQLESDKKPKHRLPRWAYILIIVMAVIGAIVLGVALIVMNADGANGAKVPTTTDTITSQSVAETTPPIACFSIFSKAPPSTPHLTSLTDSFEYYTNKSGRFSVVKPKTWTVKDDLKTVAPNAEIGQKPCNDGDRKEGSVTITSPSGAKVVIQIAAELGGKGGDCEAAPGNTPFKTGNTCPSIQQLGIISSAPVDARLAYLIKNDTGSEPCYKADGITKSDCLDPAVLYVYKQKFAATKSADGTKTEVPYYLLCVGGSQNIDKSRAPTYYAAAAAKMGYVLGCNTEYGVYAGSLSATFRIGAYAQDAAPTTEASLTSADMKLAATILSSIHLE